MPDARATRAAFHAMNATKVYIRTLAPGIFAIAALLGTFDSVALVAGASKVQLAVPEGASLLSHGRRPIHAATKTHDPLWVRCLYLRDGDTLIYLVGADLFMINRELRERVYRLASGLASRENIILSAPHIHNGPGGMSRAIVSRWSSGRFRPDILEQTAQTVLQAMEEASNAARRATIGYGTGRQLVLSRSTLGANEPIDNQIGVIRVDDSDGAPIAIVANFAAHPTTVPRENALEFSADYPGRFYEALEALASPGCVAIFLNGAMANQVCANPEGATGWEHANSIGSLLAIRAKEISNAIVCREAPISVHYAEVAMPLTLAANFLPRNTVLQTLEIDKLLITFFPGEPSVEIGLELRRQALARGYDAQFSVAPANDFQMGFLDGRTFTQDPSETVPSHYGPGIDRWIHREFGKLMTRGVSADAEAVPPGVLSSVAGAVKLTSRGTAYAIGHQRGTAFRDSIRARYEERVVQVIENDSLFPQSVPWKLAPEFLDLTALALPQLARNLRPLLTPLSDSTREALRGMADGAGLPFDGFWLLQCAATHLSPAKQGLLFPVPLCTMFAVIGDRAGADGLLVGRSLDWNEAEPAAVVESYPQDENASIQVGFTWNGGVFSGMNGAGLVLSVERMEHLGDSDFSVPPIELILRSVLDQATSLAGVQAALERVPGLRGYHVLAATPAGPDAAVFELGADLVVRRAKDGLLLGADPDSERLGASARTRYRRVAELLAGERIVALSEMQDVLRDREPGKSGRERIFNELTRHAVTFAPKIGTVYVAFPGEDGSLPPFEAVTLGAEAP